MWNMFISTLNRMIPVLIVSVVTITPISVAHSQTSFNCNELKGRWTGFGWFEFVHEGRQRARCKFNVECSAVPTTGSLSLSCLTAGDEFDARSTFAVKNNRVAGRWSIPNYNVSGAVSGSATNRLMDVFLRVQSKNFSNIGAALKVNIQEGQCRASVNIALKAPIGLKRIGLSVRRC